MAISYSTEKIDASAAPRESGRERINLLRLLRDRVRYSGIIFFTSQLSLMVEIGTPLNQALRAIAHQTSKPALREVVVSMLQDIEEGRQLSDAMRKHPQVFNPIFISMVRAGETGGFLKKSLDGIASIMERRRALVTQVRTTLTYPVILCVLSVAVILFIMIGILPKFAVLFEGKESVLPFTTRFLMQLSASLRNYWWIYAAGAAAFALGVQYFFSGERGRAFRDRFLVSAPVISGISNKIYTCQFLRTLGHLLESHVPLLQALEATRGTFVNRHFVHFIDEIREHVEQGGKFSQPFSTNPYVLESVKQMIATGEEVGNLPMVMIRLAEFYDGEIQQSLKTASSLIEPVALVILGAIIGLIVSSVILPMFKIAGALR
ncbi:MAG: type II secretion system F family protein [Syntrophales bacterium]|nr:type II secretion system F family protein [Syntrophales bacterium]